ncbi:MAG TPA: hypothetical protein VLF67_03525 [Candidatus Saccharimonas sp.]|nr:hypothetical protein [Candidatus Saccharimonas sp.]
MTPPEAKTDVAKRKPLLVVYLLIAVVAVGGLTWAAWQYQMRNFAKEAAGPLEKSLAAVSAVKKCDMGDTGRGTDNKSPWYYAVYEVPGGMQEATSSVRSAAKQAGYNLKDGPEPVNPEDNKYYSDSASKQSPYSQLKDGKVDLSVDVYGSKTHNGEQGYLCGVTKNADPPKDKTTIRFTISLPEYRR